MDFKNERLMMSEEEARNRAKELLNENQVDLITKYMFLEQQVKKQKEVINKVNKYLNEYDVFKVFSFPLMKRWEEEQIKSSIDYEFKTSLVKDLKDILKEVSE
jgi:hypothetical protein